MMQLTIKFRALLVILSVLQLSTPAVIPNAQAAFFVHQIAAVAPNHPAVAPLAGLAFIRKHMLRKVPTEAIADLPSNTSRARAVGGKKQGLATHTEHSNKPSLSNDIKPRHHRHEYIELPIHVHGSHHHSHHGDTIVYVGRHRNVVVVPRSDIQPHPPILLHKRKHDGDETVVLDVEDSKHRHIHAHGDDITIASGNEHLHAHVHGDGVRVVESGQGDSHQHVHVHSHSHRQLTGGLNSLPLEGVPGRIDITSPTVDDPVGKRIASLQLSNVPSEFNQFVINASSSAASTVYLVVKPTAVPLPNGALTVAIHIAVYDEAKAALVFFCASFDPRASTPSPLMAAECVDDAGAITEHTSQSFSYSPENGGVLKPLWLAVNPVEQVVGTGPAESVLNNELPNHEPMQKGSSPCSDTEPEDSSTETVESASSTSPEPQNVGLVFVAVLPPSMPTIAAAPDAAEASETTTHAPVPSEVSSSSPLQAEATSGGGAAFSPSDGNSVSTNDQESPATATLDSQTMSSTSSELSNVSVTAIASPTVAVAYGDVAPDVQEVDTGYAWKFSPVTNTVDN